MEMQRLDQHLLSLARNATERSRREPYSAEIVPGVRPEWHVLVTHPSCERIAAGHLIGRGFGTYLPEFSRSNIVRGRKRWQTLCIFPGYLFLFVWDLNRHMRRIESCTGVAGHLHSIEGRPFVVPDRLMDQIQAAEFNMLFDEGRITVPSDAPKRARYGKKHRLSKWAAELKTQSEPDRGVVISTKSYFAGIEQLDDSGRNQLLHKALGLPS